MITGYDIASCIGIFWGAYWGLGALFTYWNREERPPKRLPEVVATVTSNMLWTGVAGYAMTWIPWRVLTNSDPFVKMTAIYVATDIFFYHVHRAMHWSKIYKYLHKQHHEFQYTYALAGLYCGPFEMVVLNMWGTSIWPLLVELSSPYLEIWFFLLAVNVTLSHTTLTVPYLISNHHDKHHIYYNCNYGISGFLDQIYGTLKE